MVELVKRTGASVQSYLILRDGDQVLLLLRKNTGYCDGQWGFVSGHVEEGESGTDAMIREAKEEAGIEIDPSELRVVHVMHRKTNRNNVDLFFECQNWRGLVENLEPEKCESLQFFPLQNLPPNMIDYVRCALENYLKGNPYSEAGWH